MSQKIALRNFQHSFAVNLLNDCLYHGSSKHSGGTRTKVLAKDQSLCQMMREVSLARNVAKPKYT